MKTVFDISSGEIITQAPLETGSITDCEQYSTEKRLQPIENHIQSSVFQFTMPPDLANLSIEAFISGQA